MALRGRFSVGVAGLTAAALSPAASAGAHTIDCAVPLIHSVTITDATTYANCGAGGIVIGADHVTINLNGHGFGVTFGAAVSDTGYSYDTVENGGLSSQGPGLSLINTHHVTVRNVSASGDFDGMILTGGSRNRVLDSFTYSEFGRGTSLRLTRERDDILRHDTSDPTYGCQVELDQSTRTRLVDSSLGSLILAGSNWTRITHNHIVNVTDPTRPGCRAAGGLSGTGNFNLIAHNVIGGGPISLTGFGNQLYGNTILP